MIANNLDAKYADTLAITLDEENNKVTCVYKDHSLYIWGTRIGTRVQVFVSCIFISCNPLRPRRYS